MAVKLPHLNTYYADIVPCVCVLLAQLTQQNDEERIVRMFDGVCPGIVAVFRMTSRVSLLIRLYVNCTLTRSHTHISTHGIHVV